MLLTILDYFGTAVFAMSGVLLAYKVRMDIIGLMVLGGVTAIGGGTCRDVMLNVKPFWMTHPSYLYLIMATCILSIFIVERLRISVYLLPICDALGLGAFVIIGIFKSLQYCDNYLVAITMGVITGCGGGAIRDVLAGQVPFIFQREIYAFACVVGGSVICALIYFGVNKDVILVVGFLVTIGIRIPAIIYNLSLPTFYFKDQAK